MECKYCGEELRIKYKTVDGKRHKYGYCDNCRKRFNLDNKQSNSIGVIIGLFSFVFMLLCVCIILVVNVTKKNRTQNNTPTTSILSSEEDISYDNIDMSLEPDELKSLSGLSAYLLEQGVVTGEPSEVFYQYINAKNGCQFLESGVEIYDYDISSDTYQTILSTNEVMDIPVAAINGSYVLIFSNDGTNQAVIDAFKAY